MTLQEYRAKHGLSQKQFAERVGMSQTGISAIERGINFCRGPMAKKISEATDGEVAAHVLVGLDEPENKGGVSQ